MKQNNFKLLKKVFFTILMLSGIINTASAQIYKHQFDAGTAPHPYTLAPDVLSAGLTGSSWTNSTGSWTSTAGNTGQAITLSGSGTITVTLSFTVAANFQADISSYSFWRRRSNTGSSNYVLKVNGTTVGSGPVPTAGADTGLINVSTPLTGLTGNVVVTLTLTGSTNNSGTFRLDDFTLNGSVTPSCIPAVITSLSAASAPAGSVITINGSGFLNGSGTAAVSFNGIPATNFTVISDTEITVIVPLLAVTGGVIITTNNCPATGPVLNILNSTCLSGGNVTDLFISEIYDAQAGQNGAIEIYNGTGAPVNLSAYSITRRGDVGGPVTFTYNFPDVILANGATYIALKRTSTFCGFTTTVPDNLQLETGFNDDDQIDLLKNGVLIDNVVTPDNTGFSMIRNANATVPNDVYNSSEWSISNTENCINLGIHIINIIIPSVITSQPQTTTVCQNGQAQFSVAATNITGFTYQWKVLNANGNWVNVTNGGNYSGATTNTLTINQVSAGFNGNQYYCEITSLLCTLVSNAAQLTVIPLPVAPIVTAVQPTCTVATGTITVTPPATGTGYTYSIDNGVTYQSGNVFAGLVPFTYNVIIKTAEGCTSTATQQVINPAPAIPVAPIVTAVQPTCTVATGTITVTPPATGTGYTYSIDNGVTYQSGNVFAGLVPFTYNVIIKTAEGCTSTAAQQVINLAPAIPVAPIVTAVQPTCTVATGTITVTLPATGTGYTYSIDNGVTYQSGNVFAGLVPFTYNVIIKTAEGCTSSATQQVINPAPTIPVAPIVTAVQPTCTVATGTITVTPPATGTGYTYSIDNGVTYQSGNVFANLAPGSTHSVVIKTTDGCISLATQQVINAVPAAPAAPLITFIQPTCTVATGTITVTPPATGTGYTYILTGPQGIVTQSTNIFAGLTANTQYSVSIQNTEGCTSAATQQFINAVSGAPAVAMFTITQATCTTGSIITVTNALPGLEYSLDGINFQTNPVFTNVPNGNYTITVRDGACTSVTNMPIVINPVTGIAAIVTNVTNPACGETTGSIFITAPSGTGIEYSIDGITYQDAPVFTNVAPGDYTITARNNSGCSVQAMATISQAGGLPLIAATQGCDDTVRGENYLLQANALDNSFNPDAVTYQWRVAGGTFTTGDSTFNVTEYAIANNITFEIPLTIEVRVIAAGGCENTALYTIDGIFCTIPKGISPNGDTRNDSFNLTGLNVKMLKIYNRYGKEVYEKSNYKNEWFGTADNGDELPTGTYYYVVESVNGNVKTGWVYINREE